MYIYIHTNVLIYIKYAFSTSLILKEFAQISIYLITNIHFWENSRQNTKSKFMTRPYFIFALFANVEFRRQIIEFKYMGGGGTILKTMVNS